MSAAHLLEKATGSLRGIAGKKVLVLGDLMLDRYLWGEARRISPEAPVPVVALARRSENPGGAGNVACNLAGLGLEVAIVGCIGDDAEGDRLLDLLRASSIDVSGVARIPARSTTTKTRVFAARQQLLRFDVEEAAPPPHPVAAGLLEAACTRLRGPLAAVVLSDYAKGVLTPHACVEAIQRSRCAGIPVVVDPKGRDYEKYAGATAITPNRSELGLAAGVPDDDLAALRGAGDRLVRRLGLDFMVLTLGEHGLCLIGHDGQRHIPATMHAVRDVSGAGDTVIAALVAGLVAALTPFEAAELANFAAGVAVSRQGTTPVSSWDLVEGLGDRIDPNSARVPSPAGLSPSGLRVRGQAPCLSADGPPLGGRFAEATPHAS